MINSNASWGKVNPLLSHTLTLSHIDAYDDMDNLFIVYSINVKYWHQVIGHMQYQQHNSDTTRCQYLTLML